MSQNNSTNVSSRGKNMAIISLALGVLSVIFLFIGANLYVPMGLGLAGLVFTFLSKDFKGGVRTTGLIFSCLGLGIGAIGFASFAMFTASL